MSESALSAIFLTLKIATVATLVVFLLGTPLAYYLARRETYMSRILSAFAGLPLVLPPTAVGYLLLQVFSYEGPLGPEFLGIRIHILLTWKAAVLACAIMAFPLFVRTAKVAFEGVDPAYEGMKRTLGYGPLSTFVLLTLPLAFKGLLAAAILGFTRAVSEFGATIIVAGNIPDKTQTLASAIFTAQQVGNDHEANVLIVFALILGFLAIFATEMLSKRVSKRGYV